MWQGEPAGAAATRRLGYRPGLDGVRGVAVLLVVAAHVRVPGFTGGGHSGLVLFFALSGFLITSLLLDERERDGSVSLAGFWSRRARRLLPALVVMLVVTTLAGLVAPSDALAGATYAGNWLRALEVTDLGSVGHLWSLAVEEQFYLLWPLAFLVLGRRSLVPFALAATAAGSMVLRLAVDGPRMEFGGDTRADAILLGCAAAYAWRSGVAGSWLAWVPVALVTAGQFPDRTALTVAAIAAPLVVMAAADRPGPLQLPVMRWLGTRSYGLYLWHFPILEGAKRGGLGPVGAGLVTVLATTVAAESSYRYVERRFRSGGVEQDVERTVGGVRGVGLRPD